MCNWKCLKVKCPKKKPVACSRNIRRNIMALSHGSSTESFLFRRRLFRDNGDEVCVFEPRHFWSKLRRQHYFQGKLEISQGLNGQWIWGLRCSDLSFAWFIFRGWRNLTEFHIELNRVQGTLDIDWESGYLSTE